jgi:hypothetical protein
MHSSLMFEHVVHSVTAGLERVKFPPNAKNREHEDPNILPHYMLSMLQHVYHSPKGHW